MAKHKAMPRKKPSQASMKKKKAAKTRADAAKKVAKENKGKGKKF